MLWGRITGVLLGLIVAVLTEFYFPVRGDDPIARNQKRSWHALALAKRLAWSQRYATCLALTATVSRGHAADPHWRLRDNTSAVGVEGATQAIVNERGVTQYSAR